MSAAVTATDATLAEKDARIATLEAAIKDARDQLGQAMYAAKHDLTLLEQAGVLFAEMNEDGYLNCADSDEVEEVGRNLVQVRSSVRSMIKMYLTDAIESLDAVTAKEAETAKAVQS